MTIKSKDKDICMRCQLRFDDGCLLMESYPTDAIRIDGQGQAYIAYPDDCNSCFLCELDCPTKRCMQQQRYGCLNFV